MQEEEERLQAAVQEAEREREAAAVSKASKDARAAYEMEVKRRKDEEVRRQGSTLKEGRLSKLSVRAAVNKNWRTRRIVLRWDRIQWFKEAEDQAAGHLLLLGAHVSKENAEKGRHPALTITDAHGLRLCLRTADEVSRDDWCDEIASCVEALSQATVKYD
jgi:hypothetical protein